VVVTLLPGLLGLLGPVYLAAAVALGGWFLWSGIRLVRERSDDAARGVFRSSLIYLALLYAAMLADLLLR
jgi:protoheme IX farnesyltransferase